MAKRQPPAARIGGARAAIALAAVARGAIIDGKDGSQREDPDAEWLCFATAPATSVGGSRDAVGREWTRSAQ